MMKNALCVFALLFLLLLLGACDDGGLVKYCQTGTRTCDSENSYKLCEQNEWTAPVTCEDALMCVNGECVEGEEGKCTKLGLSCSGNNLKVCDEIGKSAIYISCNDKTCRDGECISLCTETADTCLNDRELELCITGQRPSVQMCRVHEKCLRNSCMAPCKEVGQSCADRENIQHCLAVGAAPEFSACSGENLVCYGGECVEDLCSNGIRDRDEVAVDCGGSTCEPCKPCNNNGDCESGFCDRAHGFVCSKACSDDSDCKDSLSETGEYCREDGYCVSKVFEAVVEMQNSQYDFINNVFTLPLVGDDYCFVKILWGDEPEGTGFDYALDNSCGPGSIFSHAYISPGKYTIKVLISGGAWGNGDYESNTKIREIRSYGRVRLERGAFNYTLDNFIIPENEIPYPLKSTEDFFSYSDFNGKIDHWDMSKVISSKNMFNQARKFNQPLYRWDVSSIEDMSSMFYLATDFNQDISTWDVGNVTDMSQMFLGAVSFNQAIGEWNTSNVTNMNALFSGARSFNQKLSNWNTSKVTDMSNMFSQFIDVGLKPHVEMTFNQDISHFDMSNVITVSKMFYDNSVFNQNLEAWDTSNVLDMSYMFAKTRDYNQPIEKWDTSKVTNMSGMFYEAQAFNQPLANLDISSVTEMGSMFSGTLLFNQPIGNWDTSGVKNMKKLFSYSKAFNQPIGDWDTSKVESMWGMFSGSQAFNQPLMGWNTANVKEMNYMFSCARMFNQSLAHFDVGKVKTMDYMFNASCSSSVESYNPAFNQFSSIINWTTNSLNTARYMFIGAKNFNHNLKNWNTDNFTYHLTPFDGIRECDFLEAGFSSTSISETNYCNMIKENEGWAFCTKNEKFSFTCK